MGRVRLERRWAAVRVPLRGLLWGALLTSAGAAPSAAQIPMPLGPEFQVNTYTTDYQGDPAVAVDADGDFVVVWESYGSFGSDSSSASIQGQRYASDGTALGSEFQVNTYTTSNQGYPLGPSVAVEGDGDFVVVWGSVGSSGTDNSSTSIQGQRYASDGTALGGEFQVNTYTTSRQGHPAVAADADGDFVVVWESYGSFGSDSFWASIQGQRYASDGTALGGQFQVNTYTTSRQDHPAVAADADGDFVVVWQSYPNQANIQGRRYASDGTALGSEFQVTTGQFYPAVAAAADGDFVVVWSGVRGRRYASDGTALGSEFQVNFVNLGFSPAVAAVADGDFVVVWGSLGSSGSDTSYISVQGQRFSHLSVADADGDGIADSVDNCTAVGNLSQLDVDGDGCGNACDCDFDQDGVCGGSDFNTFRLCFAQFVPGVGPAEDPTCAESNMGGGSHVAGSDFNLFRLAFGKAPGPGIACP